jgi:hypothetical protein
MPYALVSHLFELLYILHSSMDDFGRDFNPSFVDYWSAINEANICQLEQEGAFAASTWDFPGRGNFTYCSTMANGILLSGFFSTALNYLMGANYLYGNHPNTASYTLQQRQLFFEDTFLTEKVKLLDYINLVMDVALIHLRDDLHTQMAWYTGIVVWTLV